MINVFIPTDAGFDYKQCKKMYKKCRKKINDNQEFRDIVKNTFFYAFFDENKKLYGCIYYYMRGDKLFVNAFAGRHTHLINIEQFKRTFDWFNCDIYAETKHKTAIYCLLKCGFKKIDENLYRYRRK